MRVRILLSLLVFVVAPFVLKAQDTAETKASSQSAVPKHTVQAAVMLKKVAPEYPKKARRQHVEGTVRLGVVIAKDGSMRDLKVISGDPLLTDAAMKAVSQWRYEPTLLDGNPVEVYTTIDVVFALNKKQ